jgi:hypothetical protein
MPKKKVEERSTSSYCLASHLVRNLLMPEFRLFLFIYFILPTSSYGLVSGARVPSSSTSHAASGPAAPAPSLHKTTTNSNSSTESGIFFAEQTHLMKMMMTEEEAPAEEESSGAMMMRRTSDSSGSQISSRSQEWNDGIFLKKDAADDDDDDDDEISEGVRGSESDVDDEVVEDEENASLNYHFNETTSRRRRTLLYENWANSILQNEPSSDGNQFKKEEKTSSTSRGMGDNSTRTSRRKVGELGYISLIFRSMYNR